MKKKAAPRVKAHAFYGGRVQGVGFRYTAEAIAEELGLKGWVKNLPDGRVEVVCEGEKSVILDFFDRIRHSVLGPHIKKFDCGWGEAGGRFKGFRVEFHY